MYWSSLHHRFARLTPLLILSLSACSSDSDESSYGSAGSGGADASASPDADQDATVNPDVAVPEVGPDAADDVSVDAPSDAPDANPVEAAADGACPAVVAAPSADPFDMRSVAAGFGGIETFTNGGNTDVFLRSPTDYTRIGVRLNWGGTVVFYGLTGSVGSNVIDANDTGRELQIALYDPTRAHQPCAGNASCVSAPATCDNSITFLGWNPVQGGDECNHGATVLSHGAVGDALEVVVQPLQWNPDWDKLDCTQTPCGANGRPVDVTYRMQYRYLSEHVVEIATEVTSQETFDHPVTGQEWPTLYVSHGQQGPDLLRLLDAAGQLITIDNPANDGFFYKNFSSPGPWVSWQNADSTYGVGLAMDQGSTQYQGWHGNGATAPYFHNVRAQVQFGLDGGSTVRGVSYVALGSFDTVKAEIEAAMGARAPFGHLDEPAGGAVVSYPAGSPITVRGWALDNTSGSQVRVEVDGVPLGTFPVQGARPDVCKVYPAYPSCPDVGYEGSVPTDGLDECAHLLAVVAVDSDGNERVLGERVIAPQ